MQNGQKVDTTSMSFLQKINGRMVGIFNNHTRRGDAKWKYTEIIGGGQGYPPDTQSLTFGANLGCNDVGTLVQSVELYVAKRADVTNPQVNPATLTLIDNTGTWDDKEEYLDGSGTWVLLPGYPQHVAPYVPAPAVLHNGVLTTAGYTKVAQYRSKLSYENIFGAPPGAMTCRMRWEFTTFNAQGTASTITKDSGFVNPCPSMQWLNIPDDIAPPQ